MVVFVVKRYAVREAEKWRYAVRKGGGGVTLNIHSCFSILIQPMTKLELNYVSAIHQFRHLAMILRRLLKKKAVRGHL